MNSFLVFSSFVPFFMFLSVWLLVWWLVLSIRRSLGIWIAANVVVENVFVWFRSRVGIVVCLPRESSLGFGFLISGPFCIYVCENRRISPFVFHYLSLPFSFILFISIDYECVISLHPWILLLAFHSLLRMKHDLGSKRIVPYKKFDHLSRWLILENRVSV